MHPSRHDSIVYSSSYGPEMYGPNHRLAILCEGQFNQRSAKTAYGILRLAPNPVVAVIDKFNAGKTVREVTGIDRDTPIVATAEEAIALGAEVLVIGIAPKGGLLPEEWRQMIITCLENGLDVAAGLHTYLGDDPHFAELAEKHDVYIYDVRKPPRGVGVATGACRTLRGKRIVLTVGTDVASGKKHVAIALEQELKRRGVRAKYVPTGQTGIFIAGWGIAIDNVISDFTAGAVEMLVLRAAEEADVVVVEGQGSLIHPGYSGVTLSLIHGAMPTEMIYCHSVQPIAVEAEYGIQPPPLPELIALHEHVVKHTRPAKVVGVALNTSMVGEAQARAAVERVGAETGLPATDVIRFGAGPLADALGFPPQGAPDPGQC